MPPRSVPAKLTSRPASTPPARVLGRALRRAACAALVLAAPACLKIPAGDAPNAPDAAPDAPQAARVAWPGKPPGQLYKPGEVRVFTLVQGGKQIGTSWGRYDGPEGELHRFSTRTELRPAASAPNTQQQPSEPLRSVGEVVLDARGELVRGFERSKALELRFERSGDTLTFRSGREKEDLSFRPGTAFMAFATLLHEELMFGLRRLPEGDLSWRLVSLSGSLPTDWSATLAIPDPKAPTAAVVRTSLGEVIHLLDGRIQRVEVAADDLEVVTPKNPPAWPAWTIDAPPTLTYAPPPGATFTRRDVELPGQARDPKLMGEVLIPAGKGPFPAVLFLSSTGQQDRHGFAGPPPVDLGSHEIGDALAQAGMVVLRFDERGFGESADGPISWLAQLEDARRALRTLSVQDEVDPDRIAIVGHGEGGWKALELASEGRGVIAVALLASPGRRYEEILKAQAQAAIESIPPELRADAKKTQDRTLQALRTGKDLPPELARTGQWIREVLMVDPADLLARSHCPVFIAQGSKDFEVDPSRDPQQLAKLAKKFGRKTTTQTYPSLDHLFKPEPGESQPANYLTPGRHVDKKFLEDLSTWLRAQLKKP